MTAGSSSATAKSQKFEEKPVYDSAERRSPLLEQFLDVARYRDLLLQLISRNIKTRYKRSALGILWTMLNPLMMMVVLTFVFSEVFRFQTKWEMLWI